MFLGTFMLLLDITIVNVALPDIQRALQSSFSDLQWVVDAYALTLAALLLTAGSLADMYGRRRLYLAGLVVFTGASVLCGFAASTLMLQLSRALQGAGGAVMFAVSLALLADAFRGRDRGVAFGAWGAVTGLAVAIGPLLGGVLTSGLSWRWIPCGRARLPGWCWSPSAASPGGCRQRNWRSWPMRPRGSEASNRRLPGDRCRLLVTSQTGVLHRMHREKLIWTCGSSTR